MREGLEVGDMIVLEEGEEEEKECSSNETPSGSQESIEEDFEESGEDESRS